MTFRSRKLLDMARDESCVACGTDDGTIVAAHSNFGSHGKGMGHKASDAAVMFLCSRCHADLDQGSRLAKQDKFDLTGHYIAATLIRLIEQGRLVPR